MNEMYFYFYLLAIYWQNFAEQPFRYLSFKNDLGKLGAWKDVAVKLLLFFKGLHLIQLAQPTLTLNQHPNASFQKKSIWEANFFGFSTNLEFSSRRVLPKGSSPMPKLVSKLVVELENSSWAQFSQFDQ